MKKANTLNPGLYDIQSQTSEKTLENIGIAETHAKKLSKSLTKQREDYEFFSLEDTSDVDDVPQLKSGIITEVTVLTLCHGQLKCNISHIGNIKLPHDTFHVKNSETLDGIIHHKKIEVYENEEEEELLLQLDYEAVYPDTFQLCYTNIGSCAGMSTNKPPNWICDKQDILTIARENLLNGTKNSATSSYNKSISKLCASLPDDIIRSIAVNKHTVRNADQRTHNTLSFDYFSNTCLCSIINKTFIVNKHDIICPDGKQLFSSSGKITLLIKTMDGEKINVDMFEILSMKNTKGLEAFSNAFRHPARMEDAIKEYKSSIRKQKDVLFTTTQDIIKLISSFARGITVNWIDTSCNVIPSISSSYARAKGANLLGLIDTLLYNNGETIGGFI